MGGPPDVVQPPSVTAEYLEQRARAAGLRVTVSGTVDSDTAAEILGIAPGTLKNWRCQSMGPQWRLIGRKPWYALATLAAWLNKSVDRAA